MVKTFVLLAAVIAVTLLAGCAPGPNQLVNTPDARGKVPGFWQGWWNGFIAPVTFVISLFSPKISVYEVHNNGGWYNLGFVLGAMSMVGGGAGGAAARRRSSREVPALAGIAAVSTPW